MMIHSLLVGMRTGMHEAQDRRPEDTESSSDVKIFCDLSPSSSGGGRGCSFVIPQLIIIAFVRTNTRDEFFDR